MIILRSTLRLLADAFAVALIRSEAFGVVPVIAKNMKLRELANTLHLCITLQLCYDGCNKSNNDGIFVNSIVQLCYDCCLVCSGARANCESWSFAACNNISGCWFLKSQVTYELFAEGSYI